MAHIVINSKGMYLGHGDGWYKELQKARIYANAGAAKNSYRQTHHKEPALIQEVALMFWGSPEAYEPT